MKGHVEDYEGFYSELKKILSKSINKKISKQEISKIKVKLCKKYGLKKIPTDIELSLKSEGKQKDKNLAKQLQTKPSRTESGVTVVAIMTAPHKCPHASGSKADSGPCVYCPGGVDSVFGSVPQSYTGKEPATMRGMRNNYDAYLQVFNRLEQYVCLGHDFQKVELIIMGGTFPSFPEKYKTEFIKNAFKALNDFGDYFFSKKKSKSDLRKLDLQKFKKFFEMPGNVKDEERVVKIHKKINLLKIANQKSLLEEQIKNETAVVRCVGLTIETRPDYAMLSHAYEMLNFGCTRVELGVQSIYDDVLKRIKRGHNVKETIKATQVLKDLGFKINYHMMPGLPGSSLEKDEQMFVELFSRQEFKPDMLKIYPCMVVKGTELYDDWQNGKYKPLSTKDAAELIAKIKENVPEYCRIMRVQRDIPSNVIAAGVDKTNLRQYVDEILAKRDKKCRCIRCREPRKNDITGKLNIVIKVKPYESSDGFEFFISAEDEKKDVLFGFCRLRFPLQSLRHEITKDSALIRELHVYGAQQLIGDSAKNSVQHKGLGKKLLEKAEEIARKNKKKKIVVISGIGVREYYKKFSYKNEGPYMVKAL